jgi:hypothetical protein
MGAVGLDHGRALGAGAGPNLPEITTTTQRNRAAKKAAKKAAPVKKSSARVLMAPVRRANKERRRSK